LIMPGVELLDRPQGEVLVVKGGDASALPHWTERPEEPLPFADLRKAIPNDLLTRWGTNPTKRQRNRAARAERRAADKADEVGFAADDIADEEIPGLMLGPESHELMIPSTRKIRALNRAVKIVKRSRAAAAAVADTAVNIDYVPKLSRPGKVGAAVCALAIGMSSQFGGILHGPEAGLPLGREQPAHTEEPPVPSQYPITHQEQPLA
jgi:hypothetical protein